MAEAASIGELVVSGISHVALPATVLTLGLVFRGGIKSGFEKLFSRSSLKEFKAGAAGISATFEAERQISAETSDLTNADKGPAVLPQGQDYEELVARQQGQETPYSQRLYENVVAHLNALGVDDQSKIDLLSKEVSLLQNSVQCLNVARVLFRSQFELFNSLRDGPGVVTQGEIENHFKLVSSEHPDALQSWDYLKYLSYPVTAGLMVYAQGSYRLTEFGKSFVDFMRMSPAIIDDLAKL